MLSFDAEKHLYRVDGELIDSVSRIVSAVTGRNYNDVPVEVLERARERGVTIHKDVENRTGLTNEGAWVLSHVERFEAEKMGWAEYKGIKFAGTLDILTDEEICDIKSTYSKDLFGWAIQLNLYNLIYPRKRLVVYHVPKSGNFSVNSIPIFGEKEFDAIFAAYAEGRILKMDFTQEEVSALDLQVTKMDLGVLETNAKAILEIVDRKLEGYDPEKYSEENIQEAKRDKADLNNAGKKLNTARLELERKWMEPFMVFKDTISTACDRIKQASGKIDEIVKEVEAREKDKKQIELLGLWTGISGGKISYGKIAKKEWLNKGSKIAEIKKEMVDIVERIDKDLKVLARINEPDAMAIYWENLDVSAALDFADRLKKSRQEVEEYKADEIIEESVETEVPSVAVEAEEEKEVEEVLERTVLIRGTVEQLTRLADYMNQQKIYFKKL